MTTATATITAPQTLAVGKGETVTIGIAVAPRLASGELLTGTPTVVEVSSELGGTDLDPTIDNVQLNTAPITIRGVSYAIGQAILARVSGWSAAGTATLRAECGTDATPANTRGGLVVVTVLADGS